MAKIKVQAQHLKACDVVGSGEKVVMTFIPSLMNKAAKGKIGVQLSKEGRIENRYVYWDKYTLIGVERNETMAQKEG